MNSKEALNQIVEDLFLGKFLVNVFSPFSFFSKSIIQMLLAFFFLKNLQEREIKVLIKATSGNNIGKNIFVDHFLFLTFSF